MNTKFPRFVVIAFVAMLILLIAGARVFVRIDAGEKGVKYKLITGLHKDKVYGQGLKFILPWNRMHVYDVKIHEAASKMEVLSKNGLTIRLELSYWYKPIDDEIGYLHDEIGQEYHDKIVIPSIRSAAREIIGKYLPEELYSSKREVIEDEIYQITSNAIKKKHLILDQVLIRDVTLPTSLQDAIEKKLKQEQLALEYEFKLEQAAKEAQRLKIEAQGKAQAYEIINSSLTDRILKEKGIEATKELAQSNNAKVVVIGSGKDGMPLILGGAN